MVLGWCVGVIGVNWVIVRILKNIKIKRGSPKHPKIFKFGVAGVGWRWGGGGGGWGWCCG